MSTSGTAHLEPFGNCLGLRGSRTTRKPLGKDFNLARLPIRVRALYSNDVAKPFSVVSEWCPRGLPNDFARALEGYFPERFLGGSLNVVLRTVPPAVCRRRAQLANMTHLYTGSWKLSSKPPFCPAVRPAHHHKTQFERDLSKSSQVKKASCPVTHGHESVSIFTHET